MKRGWKPTFRLGNLERDVADEVAFHLVRTVEDLMASGMSRDQAEAEANRRFGDSGQWRRRLERSGRLGRVYQNLRQWTRTGRDIVRHAWRTTRRNPRLATGVALTFGLGVGVNAVMFRLVDRILLQPPEHVARAESVHRLYHQQLNPGTNLRTTRELWTFHDYRSLADLDSYRSVAAYAAREVTSGYGREARKLQATLVTGDFFQLLGVRPALGRFFGPREDRRDGRRVAVVSHQYWTESGSDSSMVGAALDLPEGSYEIVGVAPRGFTGTELTGSDVWLPLLVGGFPGFDGWMENPYFYFWKVVGRLEPGVSAGLAESDATRSLRLARSPMIEAGEFDPNASVVAAPLIAARGPLASTESVVVRWLAGVSIIVLLIAGFNVANLLLAHAAERREEVQVRKALGISRPRLAGEAAAEGMYLAAFGGIAGLAAAVAAGGLLQRMVLPEVAWGNPLDPRLVLFTLGVASLMGLVAAALPLASAFLRQDTALAPGRRAWQPGEGRLRMSLTASQTCLSVLLLVGAGLCVRSLHQLHGVELGTDVDDVVSVSAEGLDDMPTSVRSSVMEEVGARISRMSGVASVAAGAWSSLFGGITFQSIRVPGRDSLPELSGRTPAATLASPEMLETLRMQLIRGRWLRDGDRTGSPPVAVVNRAFAELVFQGDPLDECFHVNDGPCRQIVGIVETVKQTSPFEEPRPQYYLPLRQVEEASPRYLFVRFHADREPPLAEIQSAVLAAGPDVRFAVVEPLSSRLAPHLRPWRLGAALFSGFGFLALLVAGIGLYSLLNFEISRRVFEIGLRSALGAARARLVRRVVIRSLRLVGSGLVVGLAAAWILAPRLDDLLFQVGPRDMPTIIVVSTTMMGVALLAAIRPAVRAARIDPADALRAG